MPAPTVTIYFNSDMNIAQKCTFCAHLLDDGWKEPRCVDACPTDALRFGEEEEMKKFLDQGGFEIYKPEENTKPRVYYKGLAQQVLCSRSGMGSGQRRVPGKLYGYIDRRLTAARRVCKATSLEISGLNGTSRENTPCWWKKTAINLADSTNIDATKDINVGDIELYKKV